MQSLPPGSDDRFRLRTNYDFGHQGAECSLDLIVLEHLFDPWAAYCGLYQTNGLTAGRRRQWFKTFPVDGNFPG